MGCAWCRDDKVECFISTVDLTKYSSDVSCVTIDCSMGPDAKASYDLKRVNGAHWLGADWSVAKSPAEIKAAMEALGCGSDNAVVCYDQTTGKDAMAAATFMMNSGMKNVRVLTGMWAADKKDADKAMDKEKLATPKGTTFTKLDAKLFAELKDLKGASVSVVDMRAKQEPAFAKDAKVVSVAKFWDDKTKSTVVEATVNKDIADLKLSPDDNQVIVGGDNDALSMWFLLTAAGFKKV